VKFPSFLGLVGSVERIEDKLERPDRYRNAAMTAAEKQIYDVSTFLI